MRYEDAAAALQGIPVMTAAQGRRVYDHVLKTGARDVLDIGTFYGASTGYLAAAADEVDGHVTTVDHEMGRKLRAWETIEGAGLGHAVTFTYVSDSSYNWWLKGLVEERSDRQGNVEPMFDFCYLDGAHNFTTDGLAVILIEKLLRPGGWLLVDDLGWTYDFKPNRIQSAVQSEGVTHPLSAEERREPHMRAVFDLVVRQHPNFTTCRDEKRDDGHWGWAEKRPGAPRRYRLETSEQLSRLAVRKVRRWSARLRGENPPPG